jgi:hypothetical protein
MTRQQKIKLNGTVKRAIEHLEMMLYDEDIDISTMANIEYVIKILKGKE